MRKKKDDFKPRHFRRTENDKYVFKIVLHLQFYSYVFLTVYSFVELARFLLAQKSRLFLLSERFNKDPLKSFFGQQRARGGRSDNPNVCSFLYNAQTIRVQMSMVICQSTKRNGQLTLRPSAVPLKSSQENFSVPSAI